MGSVKPFIKMTPQRRAIMGLLEGNKSHPSAEEILLALREELPDLSFATVYNTLEGLSEAGLLRRLGIDEGRSRFDPDLSDHGHVICTSCGRIEDVFAPMPEMPTSAEAGGFKVTEAQVEYYGLCPSCQRKAKQVVHVCMECGQRVLDAQRTKACPKCNGRLRKG